MQNTKKQSVLIIESDAAVSSNLSKRFQKSGMLVITSSDGYEGYMRARNEVPAYVISETLMPSISGFKLARLLKYDERYRKIKIVLLTSNDLKIEDKVFRSCGADAILQKPFRFSELIEKFKPETQA